MAIECAGVMPTCTNKFSPCGHNFGGCLARIAIKGAVDIFSYTRFQRTGPRWFPTSSAGAAEPTGPSVPSGKDLAGPDLARTAANDAVPSGQLTDADGVIQLVTSEKCSRLGLCKLQNVALLICDIKNFTTSFERQY